jgi:hypothetical protein
MSLFSDSSIGDSLLAFMTDPGQAVFHPPDIALTLGFAAACPPENDSCAQCVESSARILSYRLDGGTYDIRAARDVSMVENEMRYEGWKGKLCDRRRRCLVIRPVATEGSLRAWTIPTGEWHLTTSYVQPFLRTSVGLFVLELATALLSFVFPVWRLWELMARGAANGVACGAPEALKRPFVESGLRPTNSEHCHCGTVWVAAEFDPE